MVPKKTKELIPDLAKELEIDESFIKEVSEFWWEELRKALSELKAVKIGIPGFGAFQIRYMKMLNLKTKLESIIEYNKREATFTNHIRGRENQKRLDNVNRAILLYQEEHKRKHAVKEKRYGPAKDLEQQKNNPGGN